MIGVGSLGFHHARIGRELDGVEGLSRPFSFEMTFVTALEQTAGFSIDGRELLLRGEKFEPVAGFKGR